MDTRELNTDLNESESKLRSTEAEIAHKEVDNCTRFIIQYIFVYPKMWR